MRMRKMMAGIACILTLSVFLTGCGTTFVQNEESSKTGNVVGASFYLYRGQEEQISFLYPLGTISNYTKENGVGIYLSEAGEMPYLMVKRVDQSNMTPEKFFKACDKQLVKQFASVSGTEICETQVGDKTLYMRRYQCGNGTNNITIERYVELYKKFYIMYTAVTNTPGEANTALYYAIETLQTNELAYIGEFSTKTTQYKHPDLPLEVKLPDMMAVQELTVGYMAYNYDAFMLDLLLQDDGEGNALTCAEDFLNLALADKSYLARFIDVEEAAVGEGVTSQIDGMTYYGYPIEMLSNGQIFDGGIMFGTAKDGGCVIIVFAIREEAENFDEISELCIECMENVYNR